MKHTGKKAMYGTKSKVKSAKMGLKGGQKKLDKNNNGKIDSQDLAMLRKMQDGGKAIKMAMNGLMKAIKKQDSMMAKYGKKTMKMKKKK